FTIDGGVQVLSAELDAATKRVVTLTTSTRTGGARYRITISGVRDRTLENQEIAPGTQVEFTAHALVNGSFEAELGGWTAAGNVETADYFPFVPEDGIALAVFNGGQTPPGGEISQTIPTEPGTLYRLEYDVGVLAWNTNSQIL